ANCSQKAAEDCRTPRRFANCMGVSEPGASLVECGSPLPLSMDLPALQGLRAHPRSWLAGRGKQ
ncbi:MAG TPA: hypothetical protein PKW32_20170, partial [Verrucomicrobiota bacterium]|nr:hypothetical protein [Verrucomicrobiota bacterium]